MRTCDLMSIYVLTDAIIVFQFLLYLSFFLTTSFFPSLFSLTKKNEETFLLPNIHLSLNSNSSVNVRLELQKRQKKPCESV